jgi:hypothetical protein
MSQLDVLRSLLRSTARSATAGLRGLPVTAALQRLISEAGFSRVVISDAELTRAVARVAHATAATVSSGHGRVRIDASFDDGKQLAIALRPAGLAFAPGGAKELSFELEPASAALDPRSHEVLAAIAGQIARGLWRPALTRAPRSEHGAAVSREGAELVVDLRSVPEVRWALGQRLPAAIIEALKPGALQVRTGRLVLAISLGRFL